MILLKANRLTDDEIKREMLQWGILAICRTSGYIPSRMDVSAEPEPCPAFNDVGYVRYQALRDRIKWMRLFTGYRLSEIEDYRVRRFIGRHMFVMISSPSPKKGDMSP